MKITRPLVRRRDQKPIGELMVLRTDQWHFVDATGKRLVSPQKRDSLVVQITAPDGTITVWEQIAMDELEAGQSPNDS